MKNIAKNKKSRFDYQLSDYKEAGIQLEGWEVKSLRAGRVQLVDAFVTFQNGQAFLEGAHISPMDTANTHTVKNPVRSRKLLLKRKEINDLEFAADAKGFTVVVTELYWSELGKVKATVALGKGKKVHDKRASEKARDFNRQKQQLLKVR
ncbi:SsrA-binding protein SmpB [Neptuniibacter sp. QD37_11]|uniref:SsrA-binding protein SmpB n=1 Tax=Neptuniibacter sp. QD37_11 TaxID=3398209 RepID=UPI0039F59EBB